MIAHIYSTHVIQPLLLEKNYKIWILQYTVYGEISKDMYEIYKTSLLKVASINSIVCLKKCSKFECLNTIQASKRAHQFFNTVSIQKHYCQINEQLNNNNKGI